MIKFAVIGRNFIVDRFLEAAKEFPELVFYGVYSRSSKTASEYAKEHGAGKIYTSLDEMCRDEQLDMVYIASPNLFHEEQSITLLNAKKHVLCEKPATLSYESLIRILDTAKKNGRVFMEAMVPLHLPALAKIKELLPRLGDIRQITLTFCQYSSRYDQFKQHIMSNTFDPTLGNGAFMDLGIYCVHMLLALFGYPEKISGAVQFLPDSIDGSGTVTAAYPDKTAALIFSKISESATLSQIQGEKGCLLIDKVSRTKKLTLVMNHEEPVVYDLSGNRHEMSYELENFIAQIGGHPMPFFNEISKLGMKFCDEARPALGINFKPHKLT